MNNTNLNTLRDVSNGQKTIQTNNDLHTGNGTAETEKVTRPKSEIVVMNETPLALSEEQSTRLKTESLDSMKLLKQSANVSLEVLKTCVTEKEIKDAKDGGPRVEIYRIEMAIKVANSIAGQLQVQNNLLKSLAALNNGQK